MKAKLFKLTSLAINEISQFSSNKNILRFVEIPNQQCLYFHSSYTNCDQYSLAICSVVYVPQKLYKIGYTMLKIENMLVQVSKTNIINMLKIYNRSVALETFRAPVFGNL